MTDQEIIGIIDRAVAEEFELDAAAMLPDALVGDDLGLDSLDIVDLVIVLEAAFRFKIREEEAVQKIRTLGDVHAFVIAKVRAREASST